MFSVSFKQLCENAYMLLRKKGNLLISLFVMMVSTGIPELKSVSDLKHLQVSVSGTVSNEHRWFIIEVLVVVVVVLVVVCSASSSTSRRSSSISSNS